MSWTTEEEKVLGYFAGCPAEDLVWLMEEYTWNWPKRRVDNFEFAVLDGFVDGFDDDGGLAGFLDAYGSHDLRIDRRKHDYLYITWDTIRGLDKDGLKRVCMSVLVDDEPFRNAVSRGDVQMAGGLPSGLRKVLGIAGKTASKSSKPAAKARTAPAKRTAAKGASGTSKTKKAAAGRPGAKKATAKSNVAKTVSGNVRK